MTYTQHSHPFQTVLQQPPLPAAQSLHQGAPSAERDPHDPPTFDSLSLVDPEVPILYLPPLLSSLPRHIPSEPISSVEHLPLVTETRLPDIDPVSLSLHKALHHFKPRGANYATVPYAEAFNWSQLLLPLNEEREWYCVVFRSKRKPGSDGGGWSISRLVTCIGFFTFPVPLF